MKILSQFENLDLQKTKSSLEKLLLGTLLLSLPTNPNYTTQNSQNYILNTPQPTQIQLNSNFSNQLQNQIPNELTPYKNNSNLNFQNTNYQFKPINETKIIYNI